MVTTPLLRQVTDLRACASLESASSDLVRSVDVTAVQGPVAFGSEMGTLRASIMVKEVVCVRGSGVQTQARLGCS